MGDEKSPQFVGLFPFQMALNNWCSPFCSMPRENARGAIFVETHSGYPPFQALHSHRLQEADFDLSFLKLWDVIYLILPYTFGRISRKKARYLVGWTLNLPVDLYCSIHPSHPACKRLPFYPGRSCRVTAFQTRMSVTLVETRSTFTSCRKSQRNLHPPWKLTCFFFRKLMLARWSFLLKSVPFHKTC